jgi:cytochrome P450 family 6
MELCKNVAKQRKAQQEIDRILAKYNGEITYDALKEMTYLNWCVNETLRLYPPAPIFRNCTEHYKIKGTNVILEPGVGIFVPIYGIHRDEDLFPNANEFMPERFNDETQVKNAPFWPFGLGPRYCIAKRFGEISALMAISSVLSQFNLELADANIEKKFKFHPMSFLLTAGHPIDIKISKRDK